jgi:hypothetical protein
MGLFGWDLPPGASMNDIDPLEGPCEVCGTDPANCNCPECPTCGEWGNPDCYVNHGLTRTQAQIDSRAAYDKRCADDAKVMPEY